MFVTPWSDPQLQGRKNLQATNRPLGYERVYLPLCKVADTPFHIQGDEIFPIEKTLYLQMSYLKMDKKK